MRPLSADLLSALREPELEVQHLVTLVTGSGTQKYSTQATSWSGETFEAVMLGPPQVTITPGDPSRGSIGGVRVSCRLANADGRFSNVPASWYQGGALTIRDVLANVSSDALRTLACVATNASLPSPEVFELQGEDWFSLYRRKPWPSDSFTLTLSAFPGLTPDDPQVGMPVPFQIGQCLHETRFIVDVNRSPDLAGSFPGYHQFLGGYYSRGGDRSEPLIFLAPNGGWSGVASCRQTSEVILVGSTDAYGRFMFVNYDTPVLPSLPLYVRNPGRKYSFFVKGGPGTSQTDYWTPTEIAHLMLVNTPFGLIPLSYADSSDILGNWATDLNLDLHQMRGSLVEQRALEDWLGDVSHDGALGILNDGELMRLETISASRAPVSSFHAGNIIAGTIRFQDESLGTLANHRRIYYPRAGLDTEAGQTYSEFSIGSGPVQERRAFFLRDKRAAQWTAEFYAKRETPRSFTWTAALSPESAPVEQFDIVTVQHPLLGSGTFNVEIEQAEWDGPRVTFTGRQQPSDLFTFTSSLPDDLNFGAQVEFLRFNQSSWELSGTGDSFTRTHSLFTAPTHIAQLLSGESLEPFIASSLVTATDSNVTIFVCNSAPWAPTAWPTFQLFFRGWQIDAY